MGRYNDLTDIFYHISGASRKAMEASSAAPPPTAETSSKCRIISNRKANRWKKRGSNIISTMPTEDAEAAAGEPGAN